MSTDTTGLVSLPAGTTPAVYNWALEKTYGTVETTSTVISTDFSGYNSRLSVTMITVNSDTWSGTSTYSGGAGELRYEINNAIAGDVIVLDAANIHELGSTDQNSVITIQNEALQIDKSMFIYGLDDTTGLSATIRVKGLGYTGMGLERSSASEYRVFDITATASASVSNPNVVISSLRLGGGQAENGAVIAIGKLVNGEDGDGNPIQTIQTATDVQNVRISDVVLLNARGTNGNIWYSNSNKSSNLTIADVKTSVSAAEKGGIAYIDGNATV